MQKAYQLKENKIFECEDGKGGSILVFANPTKDEIKNLIDIYRLDEHTVNSALDPDEISRFEFEPEHVAIILKRPKNYSSFDDLLFKVSSIGIFLFKEQLIILMPEEIDIFETSSKHALRLFNLKDVLLKIFFGTIYHFLMHLKIMNQISDMLEQKINTSMENRYLLNMFTLQKSLVYYLNGIRYNGTLFEKLKLNSTKLDFNQDELEMLDDIIIENSQCLKQAEVYTNILSNLMDARASIVNNNLSLLIKRLTIINIVFLPITFIASVGGMSEYTLMTEVIPLWLSYPIFMLAMGVVALITYLIVRKMGFEKQVRKFRPKLKFMKKKDKTSV